MFSFSRPMTRSQMGLACACLLLGLLFSGWWSAQQRTGEALRADTLRLHIRADSDSVADQTLKLMVRDLLLERMDQLCAGAEDQSQVLAIAARQLEGLRLVVQHFLAPRGAAAVRLSLVNMYFAASDYGSSALPAGRYDALRVDLGEPESYGRNWWCVLYPGLCMAACSGYDTPAENDLVCGEYILRFACVDWWQSLTARREDRSLLSLG